MNEPIRELEGVTVIRLGYYARSEEALTRLLAEFRAAGYEVADLRVSEFRVSRGITFEQMVQQGFTLWSACKDGSRSYDIYEAWRWERLPSSPKLHERVIAAVEKTEDPHWYTQNGRQEFYPEHFAGMRTFIQEFTTLDVAEWDRVVGRFRTDGPGAVWDVARFCHPNPDVKDEPNIGNALSMIGNSLSGRRPTSAMVRTACEALRDPKNREFVKEVIGEASRRNK